MPRTGRARRRLIELVKLAVVAVVVIVAVTYGGPLSSGALFLLRPAPHAPRNHDLPAGYVPVHKGSIDIGTGLYVRRDEDLVVRGTPPVILRRTYLSEYRVSREFGIGATHDGERYIRGDGDGFQWAALILAEGSSIQFSRVSFGSFLRNAMFVHDSTPTEYLGARLGWIGFHWALRRRDGFLSEFQGCGPGIAENCSVIRDRDEDGHVIDYRRDRSGRLARIEAGQDRWIAFAYDQRGRIVAASDSNGKHVAYRYDAAGRLIEASSEGVTRRYGYTDADELARIEEPGHTIENFYEGGRCVRQVNTFAGEEQPFVFTFAYEVSGDAVRRVRETQSDGTWYDYTFNARHYAMGQTIGFAEYALATFSYERDAVTNALSGVRMECRSEAGTTVSDFSQSDRESLEDIKAQLVTHARCRPEPTGVSR